MALQKTEYPLVVDGGINTKIDPKLLPIGQNLEVVNADFEQMGSLRKLNGITQLEDVISPSSTLSDNVLTKLINFKDELLALGRAGTLDLFSYSESLGKWYRKFPDDNYLAMPVQITNKKVADPYAGSAHYDSDEAPNYGARVIAYQGYADYLSNTVNVLVQDYESGETERIAVIEDAFLPQVRILDQASPVIWVFYQTSTQLKCLIMDIEGTSLTTLTLSARSNTYFSYHIVKIPAGVAFATYVSSSTTSIYVGIIDSSGSLADDATVTVPTVMATVGYIRIVSMLGWLFVYYREDALDGTRVFALDQTNLAVPQLADQLVYNTGTFGSYFSQFIIMPNIANNAMFMIAEVFTPLAGSAFNRNLSDLHLIKITFTGTVSTLKAFFDQGRLTSNPFRYDQTDDSFYFITESNIEPESTYFVVKCDPNASSILPNYVGRFSVWKASGSPSVVSDSYRQLNNVPMGPDGKFYHANGYTGRTVTTGGNITPIKAVQLTEFDFISNQEHIHAILGNMMVLSGGIPLEYDGRNLTEQNFNQYPLITDSSNGGSGSIPTGTYLYKAIWEFTDENGHIHRSTPSPAFSHEVTSGPNDVTLKVIANGLLVSSSKYRVKTFGLILYRTVKNSSGPYYRVANSSVPSSWFGTGNVSEITDDLLDTDIDGNELLYTDGEVLSFDPLPPIKYIISANNRMFALSSEDPNEIWYSHKWLPGEPVNFSAFLTLRVDQGLFRNTGDGVALGVIGSATIVLKDNCIIGFEGDGPLATGEQNSFTDPKLINSDIGCSNARSVVSTPTGIFFKSEKGIYVLTSGYEVKYIGASVEDYNDETILDSTVIEKRNLVVFVTESRALIYNYQQNKWSTSSFLAGKSVCNWKNKLAILKSDDTIFVQEDSLYKNGDDHYGMKLVTPWLKVSGIQNFGRLWEIVILGDYHAAHDLSVKVYFDYDSTDFTTYTIQPDAGDGVYQYRIHMDRQKMESVKIEIEDVPDEASSGESLTLSNITLLLGKKKGTYKNINDSRKY